MTDPTAAQQSSTASKGAAESDYRRSHVGKGSDYDDALLKSRNFDRYMVDQEELILRRLIPELFPSGIPRYLDFACGTGRITSVVESFADSSTGVDISESMLEEARAKCTRTTFELGDITRGEVEVSGADCVTAFRFFGNAQDELRASVLACLSELIPRDGYLVFNNHRNPHSLHELLMRAKGDRPETDLSYGKLDTLLRRHGFRIVRGIGVGLWIIRHTVRGAPFESPLRVLEPLSRVPFAARFCPDAVYVARRI